VCVCVDIIHTRVCAGSKGWREREREGGREGERERERPAGTPQIE